MEQKDRSLLTIFTAILIIGFVTSALGSYYVIAFIPALLSTIGDIQNTQFSLSIISIINFVIHTILASFGFYRIGKKFDLRSNLKSSIIRLMTGAYLGRFFGITTVYLIGIYLIEGFNFYWLPYLSSIFSVSFLGLFFVAFSALAIAYLVQSD